ncbi:MAG TPA: type II toxin-antitoxin system CcdA family antitoxin [Rhodocyclaceae bacterium]|nr:type II toxin-antitoxin system CcdA family antitoxin [Rhodocyclaceae bacterium]
MRSVSNRSSDKRPFNLLLNENTVTQARNYTDNLSATVETLLGDYVAQQRAALQARQQQGDAVAEAWNRFHEAHGSFADEYSTL